jgi:hypothetical protein
MRTGCAFGVAPVLAARRPSLQGKRNHLFKQPLPLPLSLDHWKMAQTVGISTI